MRWVHSRYGTHTVWSLLDPTRPVTTEQYTIQGCAVVFQIIAYHANGETEYEVWDCNPVIHRRLVDKAEGRWMISHLDEIAMERSL